MNAYQQAVTKGVSVFVSSGDEGAASCDADEAVATHGIAVSGFASTPYNVAVGGTDFMDYYDSQNGGPAVSTYWNAANTASFGSALSYIPEIPWDNSCASPLIWGTPAMALGTYTQAYGATGFSQQHVRPELPLDGIRERRPEHRLGSAVLAERVSWACSTAPGTKRVLPDVSLFAANGIFSQPPSSTA